MMAAISGVLSSFMAFVFVYSHDPIVAHFSDVDPARAIRVTTGAQKRDYTVSGHGTVEIAGVGLVQVGGVSAAVAAERIGDGIRAARPGDPPGVRVDTGSIPATFAVFAVGLVTGALLNIGFAMYRLSRNRSWHVLLTSGREFLLAIIIGVNFSLAVALMGKGMLLLGALGASVGWGIQQAMQMTGGQLLGFVSGEWRGVRGKPLQLMIAAISVLLAAVCVLALGKALTP